MAPWINLADPSQVALGGLFGEAADLSLDRRLRTFIADESSPALAIFLAPYRDTHTEGDWYGEHAGKWLVAASRAARRLSDDDLADQVRSVGRILLQCQEPSGAITSYAPGADCRYDSPNAGKVRTWDVWIQACLMLGLSEAHRLWPSEGFQAAAIRMAEGMAKSLLDSGTPIRSLGNHSGFSATVVLEPICLLGMASGSEALRDFADRIVAELRQDLIDPCLAGKSIASVGTGKIYQLIWNLSGLLRYGEWTGESWPVTLAEKAWESISGHHLTPAGGPWGGVATHKEVFNPQGYFSPYGFVETCSVWVWIQLNRDLYRATGESRYLDAIEVAVANQLLGAMDTNGEDWIYFSFPNGRRNSTYDWACCKSSGAAAWEELAPLAFQEEGDRVTVALLFDAGFTGNGIRIDLKASSPSMDSVTLRVTASEAKTLHIRRPQWAGAFRVLVDRKLADLPPNDGWIDIPVSPGETLIQIHLGLAPKVVSALSTADHHGHEIVHMDYFALTYGPWSMATGLIDGFKREETVRLAKLNGADHFKASPPPPGCLGPALSWARPDGSTIEFLPYFQAGGREMGKWRSTWLQVEWQ